MSLVINTGPWRGNAHYFDGELAEPQEVSLIVRAQDRLEITGPHGPVAEWSLARTRLLPDLAGHDLWAFARLGDPVSRLLMTDDTLMPLLKKPHQRPPVPNKGRVAKWAVAAIASVALIIFVLVPVMADQLARFIPPSGERALGEVTLGQIQSALDETGLSPVATCDAPDGIDALRAMEDRLTAANPLDQDLTVLVLDHPMINAFALPGGYIVFFRGLIDAAEHSEEVAAVFAHEIGHVVSRDPTRNALRSAGSIGVLGLLFGDFAGGAIVLFLTERLIEARYTQDAEAGADEFAYDMLLDADIAPSALANMFQRLRDRYGDADPFVAHFLSHPALGDRIDAARAASPQNIRTRPVISQSEWQALKQICR